ncbi:MAG: hypothetical protein R3B57_09610 [Phycisphaerales bacterium]
MRGLRTLATIVPLALAALTGHALANDTTFTYQGSLKDGGGPASGFYDMTFRLFSAATGGSPLATQSMGVSVSQGVFSVELDFGANNFNNTDRWLEIIVNGTTLSPRQAVNRAPYAIQTRGIYVNESGRVGMGGVTTSTSELLTLRDHDAGILMLSQGNDFGPHLTFRNTSTGLSTAHGQIRFDDGTQVASIGYGKQLGSPSGLLFQDSLGPTLKIAEGGFIGIGGEVSPQSVLHVRESDLAMDASELWQDDIIIESEDAVLGVYSSPGGVRGSAIVLAESDGGLLVDKWTVGRNTTGNGAAIYFKYGANADYGSNSTMFAIETDGDAYFPTGGRLGVGTNNPQAKLHVVGNARVNVLEVIGADVAERFPTTVDELLEPGTVIEIDPENPGHVRRATSPYSSLVAGVVSGAGGLPAGTVLGNMDGMEGAPAIALTGRVWVRCDASSGEIRPGDLLTTSGTPGHAMRVDDHGRAVGAVLGKAMSSLDQGETGLVLVLVGLQ